jgi:hypothetical protein
MIFIVFSGYLITRENIDPWFIWIYYLSPFSWTHRGMSLVEFHSDKYNDVRERCTTRVHFSWWRTVCARVVVGGPPLC